MITLVKVDDRMIHGQIVLMWTTLRKGDALIVVVDDATYNNDFLRKSVIQAGNAVRKKTYCWNTAEAISKMQKVIDSKINYFVIGRSIKQLYDIYQAGINIGNDIQYGTASVRKDGYVKVWQNINLSPTDIKMCEDLYQKGIHITFKLIPDESGTTWERERKKLL